MGWDSLDNIAECAPKISGRRKRTCMQKYDSVDV